MQGHESRIRLIQVPSTDHATVLVEDWKIVENRS